MAPTNGFTNLGHLGERIETVRGVGYQMRSWCLLIGALILAIPSTSTAQVEVKAGAAEIKFSGRIQYQIQSIFIMSGVTYGKRSLIKDLPSSEKACIFHHI